MSSIPKASISASWSISGIMLMISQELGQRKRCQWVSVLVSYVDQRIADSKQYGSNNGEVTRTRATATVPMAGNGNGSGNSNKQGNGNNIGNINVSPF
ncbi:hypothetical protein LTR09_005165 [Extremus antarcticus]|uniref:Uncharacterized protein n=1 Tax=Extremus antarcticus TaxID=702011 RepID=A0AAJ0DGX0_9PEZI|nr:hypothetical protein LTR09_005165 [Extremus antarcticus]